MTRVLLDVSPIGSRPEARTGLARVALDLASSLAALPDISLATCAWGSVEASRQFHAVRAEFPDLGGLAITPGPCERLFLTANSRVRPGSRVARALMTRAGQLLNVCRDPLRGHDLRHFDVIHSTYARIPRTVRRRARRCLITVHDITALRLPENLVPRYQVGITSRIMRSIRRSDWVVCVSEHARHDFLDYTGHPAERAVVIHNGVDHRVFRPVERPGELAAVRERFGLGDRPFVLTLSSLAPHKNLALLARIWPAIHERCQEGLLVVAGGAAANRDAFTDLFGAAPETQGVRFTGFVSDDDYRTLASACQTFLFPSLYEGFGLPVLEAMACGAPVICSNATAVPEVAGDAATTVSPEDREAWVHHIVASLNTPLRVAPDARAVARAAGFSWSTCAMEHAILYRRISAA